MGQARTINIPDHQLNSLAQHLINVVPEYFKNPVNNSRFREWENKKISEGRKKREVKQVYRRTEHGSEVNIPHRFVKHSPAGLEWGYGGSGPADLALNALAMYIGREKAEENGLYQEFKREFIATMPAEGGVIKREQVFAWLKEKGCDLNEATLAEA